MIRDDEYASPVATAVVTVGVASLVRWGSEQQKQELEDKAGELQGGLEDALRKIRALEKQTDEAVEKLARESPASLIVFELLVDGRAAEYTERFRPYAYTGNADFNVRSFRTTNVLRWEYKPGSAMFVVWQQNKSDSMDYGDFRFGRDFGGVFSAPTYNTFLIKFTYWLPM